MFGKLRAARTTPWNMASPACQAFAHDACDHAKDFLQQFVIATEQLHCIHESHNMCNCEWSLVQKQLQGLYMGWERWGLVGTMQLMGWVSLPRYHSSYMRHHFVLHSAVDSALNRCRTSHIERHIVEIVSILLASSSIWPYQKCLKFLFLLWWYLLLFFHAWPESISIWCRPDRRAVVIPKCRFCF